jgi:hypothetical protein
MLARELHLVSFKNTLCTFVKVILLKNTLLRIFFKKLKIKIKDVTKHMLYVLIQFMKNHVPSFTLFNKPNLMLC